MDDERYNVVIFNFEGYGHYAGRDLSAEQAVRAAKRLVERSSRLLIERIIITDEDDMTNFLWERDKGIVYPPREEVG